MVRTEAILLPNVDKTLLYHHGTHTATQLEEITTVFTAPAANRLIIINNWLVLQGDRIHIYTASVIILIDC